MSDPRGLGGMDKGEVCVEVLSCSNCNHSDARTCCWRSSSSEVVEYDNDFKLNSTPLKWG